MADYDINSAFKAIEEELIASMIRNMEHHIDIEKSENMTYPQWQAEQLKALQEYRINNRHNFNRGTPNIRKQIEKAIRQAYKNGRTMQEAEILKAIKNGFVPPHKPSAAAQAEFFKINERKLNALIKSVTDDIVKAKHATLRMANDQYRKVLFNAQVYFNTGTGSLRQAVDMAARDFLAKGINCVEYKNGRRVSAASYAEMALRTANTRAYLCGEAQMRDEWGISTVIVNKRGAACPLCMKWVGRVYYDDVWGHTNITDDKYPRLSTAIAGGLYHPNCKDGHTTYFEGVSTPPAEPTKQDIVQANEVSRAEAKANYAARQVEKYRRLAEYSLDDDNKAKYRQRLSEWQKQAEIAENNVANIENSGIIDVERLNRREKNIGDFKRLKINMQKKSVLNVAKKYGVSTNGLKLKIQRSKDLLSAPFYGSTDYDHIGRIDLFPNAFSDEEQLIRTIIHEKCHVMQLIKYGKKYVQDNLDFMEKRAYRFEDFYYRILKRKVK